MKFTQHAIVTAQGREKCNYSVGPLTNGRTCVTVYADGYTRFSNEVSDAFAVRNASDISQDYCCKDSFHVYPEHPLFADVAAGFRKLISYRMKRTPQHAAHLARQLAALDALAAA